MAENVIPLKLTSVKALEIIREAAAATKRVIFTVHGEQQMKKRGITRPQVFTCLRQGSIIEAPYWDNVHGTWPVTMARLAAGEKVTVALAIESAKRVIIIITAF